jgi:hypothetical protein
MSNQVLRTENLLGWEYRCETEKELGIRCMKRGTESGAC